MRRFALALIFAGLLVTRFCHLNIVWVEEGYPTAAAIQILKGKALYRDVVFDKPPLSPYFYLLWGARTGWPLRVAGAGFVFLCCWLMYRFASQLWSEREGLLASFFLAFYLTFGIPAAVMALAPDLLMIAPHIGAVWLAWRRRAFWAGLVAGVAMLINTKAMFVVAACLLWCWPACGC
jgi:4-amino-4-deoxy-L-arabinose transferase-like glycosyltransferase